MLPRGLLDHVACASIAPFLARLADQSAWPSVASLDALYADRLRLEPAVMLEEQTPQRARGRAAIYEVRIHAERKIPTRPGSWHDLMNVCVWAAFPRSKRALSARQHAIATARVSEDATKLPATRTREQDALAMLDEGGAILVTNAPIEFHGLDRPDEIWRAIDDHRVVLRLFGHALLEALAKGETRALRAAVEVVHHDEPARATQEELDVLLEERIVDRRALLEPDPARSLWLR